MRHFTAEELRVAWAKNKRLNYGGGSYRVGRMSYGDYFLEPGKPQKESLPFNPGTLWLTKNRKGKDYIIAN